MVNRTVTNYYYIASDDNLDYFVPETNDNGFIVPVMMIIDYLGDRETTQSFLTPSNLGLFEEPDDQVKVSHCLCSLSTGNTASR